MSKLLILVPLLATVVTSGCSTLGDGLRSLGDVTKIVPNALDKTTLVYKPEIQQGNVVTQEQLNELQPGMTKRQVRFVLGTPMVSDVFHTNRWEYAYTFGVGSRTTEQKHITVYFEQDRLVRIAGDMRPQPEGERDESDREVVVTVPDWEPPEKSLLGKALDTVGLDSD